MPPSAVERLERERAFHDRAAVDGRAEDRFYRTLTAAHERHLVLLEAAIPGRRVLEIGCGTGELSRRLAAGAREVVAIDLSEGRIRRAREKQAGSGASGSLRFAAMDAEHLEFPGESFDVVCGGAILHHLDLDRALDEVARVLTPGGRGIFLEPLGHNPLINLYRRRSPGERTIDEHPLLAADLERVDRFDEVRLEYFHLLALAALPLALLHEPAARLVARPLQALDRLLFRLFPPARRLGWMVVLDLSGPRSRAGSNDVRPSRQGDG